MIYNRRGNINFDTIDTSWLIEEYNTHGTFPRLIIADAWCISDVGNDGKPEVCGGDYCFCYETVSVIPNQQNVAHEELTKYQIATQFLNTWQQ